MTPLRLVGGYPRTLVSCAWFIIGIFAPAPASSEETANLVESTATAAVNFQGPTAIRLGSRTEIVATDIHSGFSRPMTVPQFAGRAAGASSVQAAPLRGFGQGGAGELSVCREKRENPGGCGGMPDSSGSFVEPQALWGAAIEASGCSEAQRASLLASLESAAGLFNSGLLFARRGIGLQLSAQQGVGCREAADEWSRYIVAQREIFVSRWQQRVDSALDRCPPADVSARPAAKRRIGSRPAAMCRELAGESGVQGGCQPVPELPQDTSLFEADLVHPDMQSCPQPVRAQTAAVVHTFALNFNFSLVLYNAAAKQFLSAQGGQSCDETVAAYDSNVNNQRSLFRSVWLGTTARIASGCRSSGGNADSR